MSFRRACQAYVDVARTNLKRFALHAFNTCFISFLLAPVLFPLRSFEMTWVFI